MKHNAIVSAAALAALASLSLHSLPAVAQAWPAKPIRVIVPWPGGGSNDAAARPVAQKMSEALGVPMVIENRAGAAGTIGAELVARAPGDGYTLMVHSATHVSNASTYKTLSYRTFEDFTPIGFISGQPWVLVVHPSLPVKTARDFITLARSQPGQISYASSGNGSSPHFGMEAFATAAKIRLMHVPYRGGPQSMASLLGGETFASTATLPNAIGQIKGNRLKALGVSTLTRQSTMPDVPPLAESAGLPGFEMNPWIAMLGPANMPRPIVDRLATELMRAVKDPDVRRALESQGVAPWVGGPEELAARMRKDFERYAALVKSIGLQAQ
ncbi:MAG: tripartite tricarboxylate transporter substrate binding protein [Burkholderiales bacterium]|jgi:tripartite-type tricarboxylate transporter receptor subunit TctC|nr:tripartite tricarboxylate transporter substrate binding protein [Burkholderiales bacterium]